MWHDMQVDMVPRGHWSKENISSFWKKFKIDQQEEANLSSSNLQSIRRWILTR
jgi:hypothetical protein